MAAEYIGLSSTPPHSLAAQRVKYRRLIIWTIRDRRGQRCYREWLVPATVLNRAQRRRIERA
jgi:hypothetical protein